MIELFRDIKYIMLNMKGCILILLIACFSGCCPCLNKPAEKKPEKKSVAREAIEGFTSKTAVDNLKTNRVKIDAAKEIGKQKQADVDELTK